MQVVKQHTGTVTVGTLMKESREADFLHRRVLHGSVIEGVLYTPLDARLPLTAQMAPQCVLVKATDWLILDASTGEAALAPELTSVCSSCHSPCGALLVQHLQTLCFAESRTHPRY